MKKVIKFLVELIITITGGYGLLCIIGILMALLEKLPLLIIEDSYTLDYLKELTNKKELIYPYLNMEHSYDVFNTIMKKYNLEPSNHLVDLLYEAIIYESNNKTKEEKSN